MEKQCIAAAERRLAERGLGRDDARALARVAARLAASLGGTRPAAIGLAGPPGTGKSTLAAATAAALDARGVAAFVLSLDDYYLGSAQRARLARREHPLFRHRGVPGTHDLDTLVADLDALLAGRLDALTLPRFDKATDDRAAHGHAPPDSPPARVLLEGWLVGVPPQSPRTVGEPVNAWEARQDPDAAWRRAVRAHHVIYDRALSPRLAWRGFLRAPDWAAVIRWRAEQEARLPQPALTNRDAVVGFLAPFERLVRHAQRTCHSWADAVLVLDDAHRVAEVQEADRRQTTTAVKDTE